MHGFAKDVVDNGFDMPVDGSGMCRLWLCLPVQGSCLDWDQETLARGIAAEALAIDRSPHGAYRSAWRTNE